MQFTLSELQIYSSSVKFLLDYPLGGSCVKMSFIAVFFYLKFNYDFTLILCISQLHAQQQMTSQIRSRIES